MKKNPKRRAPRPAVLDLEITPLRTDELNKVQGGTNGISIGGSFGVPVQL